MRLTNKLISDSLILSGEIGEEISLTNKLISDTLTLSGGISEEMSLTNKITNTIRMNRSYTISQWILRTGFWNNYGLWIGSAKWIN